jgi:hypothetical protein
MTKISVGLILLGQAPINQTDYVFFFIIFKLYTTFIYFNN